MPTKQPPLAERFRAKIDATAGPLECWLFTGYHDTGGYGKMMAGAPSQRFIRTHRISYALAHNINPVDLPSDVVVRHTCDNPPCVNPAHLVAGTQVDNMHDMAERGRVRNGYEWVDGKCHAGHDITNPANVKANYGRQRCGACAKQRQAEYRSRRRAA